MVALRGLYRLVLFGLLTAGCYLIWQLGRPVSRVLGHSQLAWRRAMVQRWARLAAAVIRMRLQVQGQPPQAPCLLVCNHLGYIDSVVLAATLGCSFVAKREVAGWPVFGLLCRHLGMLFVDRQRRHDVARVNQLLVERLRAGELVVLFAEGTTSSGARVLPFHSALLQPALALQQPVAYASLCYHTPAGSPPAHLSVCWWGTMGFLDHLFKLLCMPWFAATLRFGAQPLSAGDRKTLARMLNAAVRQQFHPVVAEFDHAV